MTRQRTGRAPLPRPAPGTVHICFHGIGSPAHEREPGETGYWVTEDDFRRVLDLAAAWPGTRLSFDDGNRSDVEIALPALLERELQAWFYPIAGRLGKADSLGPDDLRALVTAGMRIGSHGMHHRPWKSLSERQSHEELVVAREVLTEIVGAPVTRAALPLGRYDRPALTRLRRLGYTQVATSDRRLSSEDDWLSHRFSVRREEPVADLQAAVARAGGLAGGAVLAAKGIVKRLL